MATLPAHVQPRVRGDLLLNIPAELRAMHQNEGTNLDGENVGQFIQPLSTVLANLSTLMRRLEINNMATLGDVITTLKDAGKALPRCSQRRAAN